MNNPWNSEYSVASPIQEFNRCNVKHSLSRFVAQKKTVCIASLCIFIQFSKQIIHLALNFYTLCGIFTPPSAVLICPISNLRRIAKMQEGLTVIV